MLRNYLFYIILGIQIYFISSESISPQASPPHCTNVTKVTDYASRYRFDYPVAYIHPGQREAYQQLYCVKPPSVNRAAVVACDWIAPPQVQFTLGDDYVHVVRQDPSGRYEGNAVIITFQLCNHNIPKEFQSTHQGPESTLI